MGWPCLQPRGLLEKEANKPKTNTGKGLKESAEIGARLMSNSVSRKTLNETCWEGVQGYTEDAPKKKGKSLRQELICNVLEATIMHKEYETEEVLQSSYEHLILYSEGLWPLF